MGEGGCRGRYRVPSRQLPDEPVHPVFVRPVRRLGDEPLGADHTRLHAVLLCPEPVAAALAVAPVKGQAGGRGHVVVVERLRLLRLRLLGELLVPAFFFLPLAKAKTAFTLLRSKAGKGARARARDSTHCHARLLEGGRRSVQSRASVAASSL